MLKRPIKMKSLFCTLCIPPHPHNMHTLLSTHHHISSHTSLHPPPPPISISSHCHTLYLHTPTVTHSHPHSSDAHDYDLCIKLSDVLTVTAYYKSMFPSLEFTLTNKEVVCPNTVHSTHAPGFSMFCTYLYWH